MRPWATVADVGYDRVETMKALRTVAVGCSLVAACATAPPAAPTVASAPTAVVPTLSAPVPTLSPIVPTLSPTVPTLSPTVPTLSPTVPSAVAGSVRLLLAGDMMLGRRVGPVAAVEGPDLLRDIRFVVSGADVAAANLESPLTNETHDSANPNALEADPQAAHLLAGAGFDLMSLANNHSGDAGEIGLLDTIDALAAADVVPLGAGSSDEAAGRAVVIERAGVRIAFLAFDATGLGLGATGVSAGVVLYERESARRAVEMAVAAADVVVVSVHGGVEYLLEPDPAVGSIAADLVSWGADVVWGHGAHVAQPVSLIDVPDRTAVVATSLGNLLFDQQRAATQTGLLLEVIVSIDGVVAYRTGTTNHEDLRPVFLDWDPPVGTAALLDGQWWNLPSAPATVASVDIEVPTFSMGDVVTAGEGNVTDDGRTHLVISYRHPFRRNATNQLAPDRAWTDASGRSAHLGVFDPVGLDPVWAAGTLLRPVAILAVCDGGLALAFDSLDDPAVVATGAWRWWDFGFVVADELPGPGEPACADVDRDGRLDPVIVDRCPRVSSPTTA